MINLNNINAPWTLDFDRDGAEDMAILRDDDGEELVKSRAFWLPEGDDPVPPTLAALQLMVTAPQLLAALVKLLDLFDGVPITLLKGSFSRAIVEARDAATEATNNFGR
jgi:hypothetical protein